MRTSGPTCAAAAALLSCLPLAAASNVLPRAESVNDWASIKPSSKLTWTPCFEKESSNLTCARLQVPLDYDDPSRGTAAIAFMKRTVNATKGAQDLLVNPGGPGGSAIDSIQLPGDPYTEALGRQFNIVGFAPRGVTQSGPSIDCWPGHPEKRYQFEKYFYPETTNASSTALYNQYYAADIFGKACTLAVGNSTGNASYITTPLVARDMLTYIEAAANATGDNPEKAKLSYFGGSYGTVLGATFASMFPNRIHRMILDGVTPLDDYYGLTWSRNLADIDNILASFFETCHQAGVKSCPFWGPSIKNMTTRFDKIISDLKYHPIPIPDSKTCKGPLMATYSNLKQYILEAMTDPVGTFPTLAKMLSGLEQGKTEHYEKAISGTLPGVPCANPNKTSTLKVDANVVIECADGWNGTHYPDVSQYRDWVEGLTELSPFFAEAWPTYAKTALCRSFNVSPPKSGRMTGDVMAPRNTSYPLFLVTLENDPVTPKYGAQQMAKVFPGSFYMTQNATGHGAVQNPSKCLTNKLQAYLNGTLTAKNSTCQPATRPFQDTGMDS